MLCKLNRIPIHVTGEKIRDGGFWGVHEFWQIDAMMFSGEFNGRWLSIRPAIDVVKPSNFSEFLPFFVSLR